MRQQVLGQFESHCQPDARSLELCFNVSSDYSASEWRKNHLNSTFVADYAGQVANDLNPAIDARLRTLNDTISYVANELLEQAMLQRLQGGSDRKIRMIIRISDTSIRLYIRNRVDTDHLKNLTDTIASILTDDPASHYIQHLLSEDELRAPQLDRLRYLSMIVDHEVDVAWKIERTDDDQQTWVTTMTKVRLQPPAHYAN